jgi:hypothetical protein
MAWLRQFAYDSLQTERINLIAEGTATPVNIDSSMALGPIHSILSPTALGGGLIRQAPHSSKQSLGRSRFGGQHNC